MEHTPQHSLLPWKTEGRTIWADDRLVAGCAIMHMDDGEPEGNAAFIVSACNNFEDMKAALTMALVQVQQDNDERKVPSNLRGTETQIRAILQRIEKGE